VRRQTGQSRKLRTTLRRALSRFWHPTGEGVGPLVGFANRCRPLALKMASLQLSIFRAEMNASCGMSTLPNWRIFFLPAFCLSSNLRLRVASPP